MKVAAVVPVKNFDKSKSRLSPLLNSNQRIAMSQVMMKHTLSILSKITFISPIIVVSCDNRVRKIADAFGADFVYEQETGVNGSSEDSRPLLSRKRYSLEYGHTHRSLYVKSR